jgi:glycosyltransferase involved in cell wall biosynthesis
MESLKIIFWQNINSMHQSAFLKALAQQHDVTLVTIRRGSGREEMGWFEPELPGVTLLQIREIDWKALIRKHSGADTIHVFAGLHAFAPIHRAFLYARRYHCRIGVYAEPLVMEGLPGLIKHLRGLSDAFRFAKSLEFILCIGKACRRQYLDWGFPAYKLFDWAYVTESIPSSIQQRAEDCPFRIIFPASCSKRKGADLLLEATASLKINIPFELICYSLSSDARDTFEQKMQIRYGDIEHIRLLPFIENHSVKIAIGEADLMVLPSRFDGWGAVVNEALGAGTPVLVSNRCGSSTLIADHALLGSVFSTTDVVALKEALSRIIGEGKPTFDRRVRIRAWAENHISGLALAGHFNAILGASHERSRERILTPWENESTHVEPTL